MARPFPTRCDVQGGATASNNSARLNADVEAKAAQAAKVSDGVILGSAIVKLIETNSNPVERDRKLGEFLTSIKKAINS